VTTTQWVFGLTDPWIGFWLPVGLLCIAAGFWLTDAEDVRRRFAIPLAVLSVVTLLVYGGSTRGSDIVETSLLGAALGVAGPVILMLVGCLVATFSGPAPVGPLPKGLRPFGFIMACSGIAWIGTTLLQEPPGSRANGLGEVMWSTWVMTFLASVLLIAATAAVFAFIMGEKRRREVGIMASLAAVSGAILLYLFSNGSVDLSATGWLDVYWQQLPFITGGFFGLIAGVAALILSVYIAEKRTPEPDIVAPLSEDERARITDILREHLNIGGEE